MPATELEGATVNVNPVQILVIIWLTNGVGFTYTTKVKVVLEQTPFDAVTV